MTPQTETAARADRTSLTPACMVKKIASGRELPAQPAKGFVAVPRGGRGHSWFSDCWAPLDTCPTELFAPDSPRTMVFLSCRHTSTRERWYPLHKHPQHRWHQQPEFAFAGMQGRGRGWEDTDGGILALVKHCHSLAGSPKPAALASLPAHCCLRPGHGPGPRPPACRRRCPLPHSRMSRR